MDLVLVAARFAVALDPRHLFGRKPKSNELLIL